MSGTKRRSAPIWKDLDPQVQRIADRENKGFVTVANELIQKALANRGEDLTPQSVLMVLPGFQTRALVEVAITCLDILSKRANKTEDSPKAQRSIEILKRLVIGDLPTDEELVKACNYLELEPESLIKVVDAVAAYREEEVKNGDG